MLARWRSNPISFIETVLYDPETKKLFQLLPAERAFLEHAFKRDDDDRLLYPEQIEVIGEIGAWPSSPISAGKVMGRQAASLSSPLRSMPLHAPLPPGGQ